MFFQQKLTTLVAPQKRNSPREQTQADAQSDVSDWESGRSPARERNGEIVPVTKK